MTEILDPYRQQHIENLREQVLVTTAVYAEIDACIRVVKAALKASNVGLVPDVLTPLRRRAAELELAATRASEAFSLACQHLDDDLRSDQRDFWAETSDDAVNYQDEACGDH